MNFDKEGLNTLRLQKFALKARNVKLTDEDLARYKTFKTQEGEILLQKAIVEGFVVEAKKYDNRRLMLTDMSEWLQVIFYLEMLQPYNFCIDRYSHYVSETDEVRERKTISCKMSAEQLCSKFKPEEIEGINLEEMKKTLDYLFSFLGSYSSQLCEEKSNRISYGKDYMNAHAFINSNELDQLRRLLNISIENVSDTIKSLTIMSLRRYNKAMENEVKPLAQFYDSFIQTLESFQKEIEERNKKDTVIQ
jgi:hypothetical protein